MCQLLSFVRGDVMNLLDDVCLSFLFRSSEALNAAQDVKLLNLTVEPKIVQTHWQTSWRCVKLPSRTEVYGEFQLSNTMHAGKSASLSCRNFCLNDLIELCPVSSANKSIEQSPSDADVSVRGDMRSKRPSDASDTSNYWDHEDKVYCVSPPSSLVTRISRNRSSFVAWKRQNFNLNFTLKLLSHMDVFFLYLFLH